MAATIVPPPPRLYSWCAPFNIYSQFTQKSQSTYYNHKIELKPDRETVTKYSPLEHTTDLTSTVKISSITEFFFLSASPVSIGRNIQFFGKELNDVSVRTNGAGIRF